jgi:hypothetical protein
MKLKEFDKAWIELQNTIERAHEAAKNALNGKKHGRLFEVANWLHQAENLVKRRKAIETEAFQMAASGNQILNPQNSSSPLNHAHEHSSQRINGNFHFQTSEKKASAKARGKAWRLGYVKSKAQLGEHLHRITETLYRTPAGLTRGIAYASESAKRPEKWFLGLPHDQFQEVVLICESLDGSAVQIHLPKSFMDKCGKHFSFAHGQTLFNIIRSGGKFIISIPNMEPIDLTGFTEPGPSKPLSNAKFDISEFV